MTIPKNQEYYSVLQQVNAPMYSLSLYETLNHSVFTVGDVGEIPIDEFDDYLILDYNMGIFGRYSLVCLNSFSLELIDKTSSIEVVLNSKTIEHTLPQNQIELTNNNYSIELNSTNNSLEL